MKRVIGFGGVFFKARDPAGLADWYRRHLGLPFRSEGGAVFCALPWATQAEALPGGYNVLSTFPEDTPYFAPSTKPYMLNLVVDDLDALLPVLLAEGVSVDEQREDGEFGKFAWVMDPEGNRIELWQMPPPADGQIPS